MGIFTVYEGLVPVLLQIAPYILNAPVHGADHVRGIGITRVIYYSLIVNEPGIVPFMEGIMHGL